jgi:hypothetical protein
VGLRAHAKRMPNLVLPTALLLTLVGGALVAGAPPSLAQTAAPATSPGPAISASPAASATPYPMAANPPENPLVTERVRHEFEAWQRGHIDRTTYSPNAGGTYINAFVQVVKPDLAAIGPLQSVQYLTASPLLGDVVYRYDVTGTSGAVSILYLLNGHGKTDLIVFTPQIFGATSAVQ